MEATVKISYSPEEQARQGIRSFVNEGLKDVQENAIYDLFFYEIEEVMNTVIVLRFGYNRRNWKEILLKR